MLKNILRIMVKFVIMQKIIYINIMCHALSNNKYVPYQTVIILVMIPLQKMYHVSNSLQMTNVNRDNSDNNKQKQNSLFKLRPCKINKQLFVLPKICWLCGRQFLFINYYLAKLTVLQVQIGRVAACYYLLLIKKRIYV